MSFIVSCVPRNGSWIGNVGGGGFVLESKVSQSSGPGRVVRCAMQCTLNCLSGKPEISFLSEEKCGHFPDHPFDPDDILS